VITRDRSLTRLPLSPGGSRRKPSAPRQSSSSAVLLSGSKTPFMSSACGVKPPEAAGFTWLTCHRPVSGDIGLSVACDSASQRVCVALRLGIVETSGRRRRGRTPSKQQQSCRDGAMVPLVRSGTVDPTAPCRSKGKRPTGTRCRRSPSWAPPVRCGRQHMRGWPWPRREVHLQLLST
jgi:hypothetical protein